MGDASQHARFAPSSMGRLSACTGSLRAAAAVPEDQRDGGSVHTREGEAAHALGARCLMSKVKGGPFGDPRDYVGWTAFQVVNGGYSIVPRTSSPMRKGIDFEVTEEMAEAVGVYVELVRRLLAEAGEDAKLVVEERVQPARNPIHEDCHGTPDAVIVAPAKRWVYVVDYKHGQGVSVRAEGNDQLLTYGILTCAHHGLDVDGADLVIVQPRARDGLAAVRPWRVGAGELVEGAARLREKCEEAEGPNPTLVAGDHCRFCPAKAYRAADGSFVTCSAAEQKALEVARHDFTKVVDGVPQPPEDPDRLAFILENEEGAKDFFKACRRAATEMAKRGDDVPRHKLVREATKRKYRDKKEALAAFRGLSSDPALVQEGLIPLTQLKRWIDKELEGEQKEKALALFAEHVVKPDGDLVLVHESDGRKSVEAGPRADFDDAAALERLLG